MYSGRAVIGVGFRKVCSEPDLGYTPAVWHFQMKTTAVTMSQSLG